MLPVFAIKFSFLMPFVFARRFFAIPSPGLTPQCCATAQHSDSHHCISIALLFDAGLCRGVTLPCFAAAIHGLSWPWLLISVPCHCSSPHGFSSAVQIVALLCHRSAAQLHAIALPLLSFRCYAVAQLIEADPLPYSAKQFPS